MERRLSWGLAAAGLGACLAAAPVRAGEPVVGVDVGAAIPVSTFKQTAHEGGSIALLAGYQFGDAFAFTPLIRPQFVAFQTGVEDDEEVCLRRESDVTSLFSIAAGGRFSLSDAGKEVYFSALGGFYTDLTGPLNDEGEGFSIGGGFNYDLHPGTALGLFIRRDQVAIPAARGSRDDLEFLTTGVSFRHRFLPPPPAPPPPPVVAEAPPPPPPPPKKKIVLRGVHFDFDKASIRADARPILDEAARTLTEHGTITIAVEGHTDSVGSEAYNQRLSIRRAEAVRDHLAGQGIDAARMSVAGFGESSPVATNATADGRAQNRRVELRVTQQPE